MEKMSFGRVNNRKLEDNFIRALKNPNFIKVVNTLDIKDEIKEIRTTLIKKREVKD